MKNIYFLTILFSTALHSQKVIPWPPIDIDRPVINRSLVVFGYDGAGNQVLRGPDGLVLMSGDLVDMKTESLANQVANSITAGPVPVKDDLTVFWKEEVRDYILSIDLLPYNASTILNSVSAKSLRTTSYVFRMDSMPYGVYYLKFNLSDGSVYTRTVTKN